MPLSSFSFEKIAIILNNHLYDLTIDENIGNKSRRDFMKKSGILVIALALLFLVTGFVMADPGVNATFETQGVALVTSIQATGNLRSMTDLTWSMSSGGIVSSGTDPTLAGYPNWDNYPLRRGV